MREYTFDTFGWTCHCGFTTREVRVGTTSHYHLIGIWKCVNCDADNIATMPFEDLVKGVPTKVSSDRPEWTELDKRLLKQAHISEGGQDAEHA